MGAHDYIVTIKGNEKEVQEKWNRIVEEDGYESGRGAYAGNATTMNGRITFYDRRLSSEHDAREFCLDKHEKWDGPVAVSFYLPATETKADEKRRNAAREKLEGTIQKQYDALTTMQEAFVARKSTLVGCKGCGSRLSHPHMVKTLHKGHASEFVGIFNGRPRRRTFRLPTLPVCLVCKASLLSETDQKRVAAHDEKVKKAQAAYDEALKPRAGKELAWAVGGWAAS